MAGYQTKQRKELLTYLSSHADESLSAKEIATALSAQGISRSAVYRNLAVLEEEGLLRRAGQEGRETLYRFIGAPACKERLHLSCKRCGKTFHLDEQTAAQVGNCLFLQAQFALDRTDTVLYGCCADCMKKQKESEAAE